MIFRKAVLLTFVGLALAACARQPDADTGIDSKKLAGLRASIWTDPLGCQHWVIDDGVEGYLTTRLDRQGRPVCPNPVRNRSALETLPRFNLAMSTWTDPRGCQHWVRDDGGDGFMSQRLDRQGRPVCPGASQPAPTEPITLAADALFDTDKADLRPEAVAELTDFGRKMQRLNKRSVFVVGHTDSRASEAYNLRLSQRRVQSVARFLEKNYGIISQTEGRGESDPVASNDTVTGRQANRRVEISILD